jgi:hypothetical protein
MSVQVSVFIVTTSPVQSIRSRAQCNPGSTFCFLNTFLLPAIKKLPEILGLLKALLEKQTGLQYIEIIVLKEIFMLQK